MKSIKKKLSRKERDLVSKKVASKLKEVGAAFPDDDFTSLSNSGRDSESVKGSCRHSKKSKVRGKS